MPPARKVSSIGCSITGKGGGRSCGGEGHLPLPPPHLPKPYTNGELFSIHCPCNDTV